MGNLTRYELHILREALDLLYAHMRQRGDSAFKRQTAEDLAGQIGDALERLPPPLPPTTDSEAFLREVASQVDPLLFK